MLLFLCSNIDLPGGTERAVINNANLFQQKGHQVTLLIFGNDSKSFYPLNPQINLITKNFQFGISSKGNSFVRKVQLLIEIGQLRKILKQQSPEIVISTEYAFTIAAYLAVGGNMPIYSWEHHHFNWLEKNRFWRLLFNWTYPKIKSVICLNEEEEKLFQKIGCKTRVISNIAYPTIDNKRSETKTLLTVGWLIKRKGVDLIPYIASKVTEVYPDWKFQLIGEGEEKHFLEKEIERRKLQAKIEIIKPQSSDLSSFYNQAAIYLMTSRFECFPMVLLEAMSRGVPCVAFDCPTGPAHIITTGEDGILVEPENVDAMAHALIDLIGNEEKRIAMGKAAQKNIQRFSPDDVYALWENLFNAE